MNEKEKKEKINDLRRVIRSSIPEGTCTSIAISALANELVESCVKLGVKKTKFIREMTWTWDHYSNN